MRPATTWCGLLNTDTIDTVHTPPHIHCAGADPNAYLVYKRHTPLDALTLSLNRKLRGASEGKGNRE